MKNSNTCVIEILERENRKNRGDKLLKKIMDDNFPEIM